LAEQQAEKESYETQNRADMLHPVRHSSLIRHSAYVWRWRGFSLGALFTAGAVWVGKGRLLIWSLIILTVCLILFAADMLTPSVTERARQMQRRLGQKTNVVSLLQSH
jgi:hypothetical protein